VNYYYSWNDSWSGDHTHSYNSTARRLSATCHFLAKSRDAVECDHRLSLLINFFSLTPSSSLVGCRRWGCMDYFSPLFPVWHIPLSVRPILMKFGTLQQILKPMTVTISANFSPGNRTACRQRQHDINCKFSKSRRWTAAILKIVKSPYLSEKSSDFDEIWYTTADIEPNDIHVAKKYF